MNLKRYIPIVAIALCLFTSCKKAEESNPDPEPTLEIEITFDINGKTITPEILHSKASDKTIRTIYLVPTGHWNSVEALNIQYFRNSVLQPRLDISPKIRGRGDFDFKLGEASKVPEDSLWFVQQGWTINKKYQH